MPAGRDATWLYDDAPFVVVAHNTSPDPRFVYANRAAQACFGYDWPTFTSLPSRLSAEAPDRSERQALLDAVARNGFMTGYRGLRIAASGRRFWTLRTASSGSLWAGTASGAGQAATFSSCRDARAPAASRVTSGPSGLAPRPPIAAGRSRRTALLPVRERVAHRSGLVMRRLAGRLLRHAG